MLMPGELQGAEASPSCRPICPAWPSRGFFAASTPLPHKPNSNLLYRGAVLNKQKSCSSQRALSSKLDQSLASWIDCKTASSWLFTKSGTINFFQPSKSVTENHSDAPREADLRKSWSLPIQAYQTVKISHQIFNSILWRKL
jgi:hypothetical protein